MVQSLAYYQPPAQLLQEQIILITGAGDGIGAALAERCAAEGATVILLGRTIAKLEAVYDRIMAAGSPQPAIYPMNLEGAAVKDYADIAATVASEFGYLSGLVHNASLLGTLTPIEHYDPELWMQVLQVNLNAPFLLTQALLGVLKAAPSSSVIFTSSTVGRVGRAYWGAYGISKAGNEMMMQMLAAELEENTSVRVNSLNPGAVRTQMRAKAYPGEDPNRLPRPEAILGSYLYLLGRDSLGVTGQQFNAQ